MFFSTCRRSARIDVLFAFRVHYCPRKETYRFIVSQSVQKSRWEHTLALLLSNAPGKLFHIHRNITAHKKQVCCIQIALSIWKTNSFGRTVQLVLVSDMISIVRYDEKILRK